MNQSRKVTEGALMIGIFAILLVASLFVPVIRIFILLVTPLPFVIYAARHGLQSSLLIIAGALIISAFIVPPVSIPIAFATGIGGVLIGHAIFKKASPYEAVMKGTAGFAASTVVMMAAAQLLFQVNVLKLVDEAVNQYTKTSIKMLESTGASKEQADLFLSQANLIKDLVPASLILTSGVAAFIVTWLAFKLLNRIDGKKLKFPRFRDLQLPSGVVWLYLAAIVFAFAVREPGTVLYIIATNAMILLEVLVILQGISFLFHFSWKKKIATVWPAIITIIALILPPVLYIVRFIGVLDIGLRLRERIPPKQ
ncbi:YybS family protein [Aciduricibacillus chroicocephali]|uniref:YybS family protein n=1 Tax=Aciduricibacillus chroicocephali TaxID=3054939 RepID=A0ABY9KV13_9BACI|nr:YybS family protein [Bacillaceae bacterium 44XB]